jgi:hypothetical protein
MLALYMLKNANILSPKSPKKFICEKCDYLCFKSSEYNKHLATAKHQNGKNANKKISEISTCECGKVFKHLSSLSRHKKTCNNHIDTILEQNKILVEETTNLKKLLIEQSQDFKNLIFEVCQKIQPTTINNNSHNKTFNLQFFLNETCKDAMNIMDFVDSFTLQLSDLESVSQQGYVDGISTIIVKKLNEMDVHKRPIHCSDAKREIMYVKDQDKWAKEEPGYAKLRKAIKYISKKNSDLLGKWSEAHPASKNITTQTNTEYMQMIVQAMGGRGEISENENKIIKKIARTVLIEKE